MAKNGNKHAKSTPPPGRNGNVLPADSLWQPGQSGNPNGRPRSRPMTEELRRVLLKDDAKALKALVAVGLRKALNGDVRFWTELINRMDGKLLEALDITTGGQPIGPDLTALSAATKAKVIKELHGPEDE